MVELLTVLRLLGGVALLLSNAFFVAIEFAMTRVRQFPESEFTGHRGLELAWEMTERLEIFLSGCQVGITTSSVSLGVVAEPAATAVIDAAATSVGVATPQEGHTTFAVVASLAIINILHVIIGEQTPTYFGVERTKTAAKYGAPVLYGWTKLMAPVIRLADWAAKAILKAGGITISRSWTEEGEGDLPSSRSELRRQMGDALGNVGLTDERKDEVMNALEIGELEVSEIMNPREEVVALSTTNSLGENLERIREAPHVRLPLVDGDLESFEGVVYTPAVLARLDDLEAGETTLDEIAAPPMTVAADAPVSNVIDQFQANNQELALVLEGGEVVGLVTITDAFEAIAGDLEDPIDERLGLGA
ncbi:MAG: CNNM domain-containing protein [Haloarculaceae archaeon]